MPRRYRKRRRIRKRRSPFKRFKKYFRKYRKLRRRGGRNRISVKKLGLFNKYWPDEMRVKHKCVIPLSLLTFNGVRVLVGNAIQGNQLFDPSGTMSNLQPYGYDQMCALYTTYRINAAKITCKLQCYDVSVTSSSTVPNQMQILLMGYQDHVGTNDFLDYTNNWANLGNLTLKNGICRYFTPDTPNMAGGSPIKTRKWSLYCNWHKVYGHKIAANDITREVDYAVGPNLLFNFGINVGDATGAAVNVNTQLRGYVIVTYYVIWGHPRICPVSTSLTTTIATGGNQTFTGDEATSA